MSWSVHLDSLVGGCINLWVGSDGGVRKFMTSLLIADCKIVGNEMRWSEEGASGATGAKLVGFVNVQIETNWVGFGGGVVIWYSQ